MDRSSRQASALVFSDENLKDLGEAQLEELSEDLEAAVEQC